jgi:hypothetical protein
MRVRYKTSLLTSLALGAFMAALGTAPARADDTAAEIRALKAQLRALEAKVDAQSRRQEVTQHQIAVVAAKGPIYAKGAPLPSLTDCPPGKFCYKGITITPGGFFALEGLYREHGMAADIGTPFAAIPFPNTGTNVHAGHTGEFRFSARQSRLSLLVEGRVNPVTSVSGYGEFDFLGGAQTANSNESNSYNPRIRHLYSTIDQSEWGLHVLAGQTWSLATMNGIGGIIPRKEVTPLTIDAQYVPGFVWARQPQIRVVKDFGPSFSVGVSAENPQTSGIAGATSGYLGGLTLTNSEPATGGGLFNSANSLSLNQMPDFVGKASWDPVVAGRQIHVEGWGLLRDFSGRLSPTGGIGGSNEDTLGGGAGGGIIVPVVPKLLDVQFSGAIGDGLGRYGTSGLPDVTTDATGRIKPIPETMLLAGAVVHFGPQLDVYAYAGQEEEDKNSVSNLGATHFGLGNPALVNSGCDIEGSALACAANTRRVRQATVGFWDTVYSGSYGLVKAGAQYSYTERTLFAGVGGAPTTSENIVMTSLRYYPF